MAGDNIVDLQVGIGADLSQLEADLETAKQKIADISDSKTNKVKIAVTPDVDTKALKNQIAGTRTQAAIEKQARNAQRAALREQANYQKAINQLRSASMSSYQRQQERITSILHKQLEAVNRRITIEKSASTGSKQTMAALQLQKATLKTTAYTAKLSVYAKDVAKQINKAKNNMSGMQGYTRSTANIFKGIILSQAFYKGVNAVKGVLADAWELSIALNSAEAAFSGMLSGGQEQAQGLLEVLKQEAIATPFNLDDLLKSTRQLTAYGIEAKNLMYIMRAVEQATAASGDATKMEAISRALGQMYTRGKVVSQEIVQLQEAGIAAGDILKEELGLPDNLSQDWGKLNIDANTAINAIVRGIDKRYGQALDNMAKTTEQKISNMKESFALIAGSITDPIRRAVDSIVDVITPKVEQLYQAIQAVGLGNALKTLIPPAIFDGVVTVINKVVSAFQALKIVFQQIKPVIDAVLGALAWYGNTIYNVFIGVIAVVGMLGQALGGSARGATILESGLKRVLGALLAYKAIMLVVAAVSKIWSIVSLLARGVMIAVQGVIVSIQAMAATMSAAGLAGASGLLPIVGVLFVIIGLVAALAGKLGAVSDAVKRVGAAFKNLGGGTSIGDMFKDMSSSLQTQIDAYNKKVAEQNASLSNALIEDSNTQTENSDSAASATKKAMEGLMSFDEVYKLNETGSGGGGGGIGAVPIEIEPFSASDYGGIFDGIGGLGDDLFNALNFDELQNALGDLWSEIYPLLDDVLLYVLKMVGYFAEMYLKAKLMTSENEEQWQLEKAQTSEDTEQAKKEKEQTSEDTEQAKKEKEQTSEDTEQAKKEKEQTSEDTEQAKKEKEQTSEDTEQAKKEKEQTSEDTEQAKKEKEQTSEDTEQAKKEKEQTSEDTEQAKKEKEQTSEDTEQLSKERSQTLEDTEQLSKERSQTLEEAEQLAKEKQATGEDAEQLAYEKSQTAEDREQWTITRTGGTTGGTGQLGTGAALALINVAQIGASVSSIIKNIDDLKEGSDDLNTWVALFVNGLMMAVDVLQLFSSFKLIKGALTGGATAAGLGAKVAGGAAAADVGAKVAGGAAVAGGSALAGGLAVGAGLAGLGALIYALQQQGNVLDENKNKTKALVDATNDSAGAYAAKVLIVSNLNTATKNQTERLFELAGQTKRTSSEQAEMDGIIDKLNKTFPSLNLGIDTETGKLNIAEDAVWKYVDAQKERDRLALLTERRNELLAKEVVFQDELAAAQERLAAAEKARSEAPEITMDLQIAVENAREEVDLLTDALDENGERLALVDEKYQESAAIVGDSQDDIIESIEDRIAREAEEYEAAEKLLEKQQDAYHQYYTELESLTQQHHSSLNAISAAGYAEADITMDDWLTGMTKRQEQEYEYQENLAKLKGRDIPAGMLEELEAAGPEYSKLIKELADSNDTELEKVVDVWEDNAKLARELALKELGPMPDDACDLLKRYRAATDEELEKLVDSYAEQHQLSREEAVEELSGLTPESAAIVQEAIDYVKKTGTSDMRDAYSEMGEEGKKGLSSTERDAIRASGSIADKVVDEAKKRKDDMKNAGSGGGGAYADGIDSSSDKSKTAGDGLANTAIKGANSGEVEREWLAIGLRSANNYIKGLGNNPADVWNAGTALADNAKKGAESVNFQPSGESAGQAFITGINNKSTSINTAFKTLLNGMLTLMDRFTSRVATALNTMLSRFASTMRNLSVSPSGTVRYSKMQGVTSTRLADGGAIKRAARGIQLVKKSTMLAPDVEAGEAGTEIVFPLENTSFIKSFAKDIAQEVGDFSMQQSARHLNAQLEQARSGAIQSISFSAPSAEEISDAIRSWFTPQMKSLHDVLEQDRTIDVTVPNTSNAMWRMMLSELKAVNASSGARGLSIVG